VKFKITSGEEDCILLASILKRLDMKEMNINEKLEYAFTNSIRVHLKLTDGSWRNGLIKEIGNEFIIFDDKVNGKESLFLMEVFDVKPFMEDGK